MKFSDMFVFQTLYSHRLHGRLYELLKLLFKVIYSICLEIKHLDIHYYKDVPNKNE